MTLKKKTRITKPIVIALSSAICPPVLATKNALPSPPITTPQSIFSTIAKDYSHFYATDRLLRLTAAYAAMGVVANSKIDDNIQNWYQDNMRSSSTDNFAKTAKLFGEGKILIPVSLLMGSRYYLTPNSQTAHWGLNTARAYLVGSPAILGMQIITGASRPEDNTGANWRPLNDNNGVSGHAFIGAVPFITLAKMNDNKVIKGLAYAASGLAAWSRVNDNMHYISQSLLGWYMAYESAGSVFDTNKEKKRLSITPIISDNYYGLNLHTTW